MKKILSGILICMLILSGCGKEEDQSISNKYGVSYLLNDVQKEADDEISANEAIMIISSFISPESEYDIMNKQVVYSVEGREDVNGTTCYTIKFDVGQEDKFETISVYAVDVHGNSIFEKDDSGEWKSLYSK